MFEIPFFKSSEENPVLREDLTRTANTITAYEIRKEC